MIQQHFLMEYDAECAVVFTLYFEDEADVERFYKFNPRMKQHLIK